MNDGSTELQSARRIASPEQLNDYLKVTNPKIWLLLAAVVLSLLTALIRHAGSDLHHLTRNERDDNLQQLQPEQDEDPKRSGLVHALDKQLQAAFLENGAYRWPRQCDDEQQHQEKGDKPAHLDKVGGRELARPDPHGLLAMLMRVSPVAHRLVGLGVIVVLSGTCEMLRNRHAVITRHCGPYDTRP